MEAGGVVGHASELFRIHSGIASATCSDLRTHAEAHIVLETMAYLICDIAVVGIVNLSGGSCEGCRDSLRRPGRAGGFPPGDDVVPRCVVFATKKAVSGFCFTSIESGINIDSARLCGSGALLHRAP